MNAQVSYCPISHFGSVHVQLESPGELIKTDRWAPTHRVSDSVSLGWDPRICVFNKFLEAAATAGPRTTP